MPEKSPTVEIACAGCGRVQRVRKSKVVPCDAYTCALGSCNRNPGFKTPAPPEGYVCEHVLNAAGGFSGYRLRIATAEEERSVARARAIRDAAGQTGEHIN